MIRDEIRAALVRNGPSTAAELLERCPEAGGERSKLVTALQALRTEKKVRSVGVEAAELVYDIDAWPAQGEKSLRVPGSALEKPPVPELARRAPPAPTTATAPKAPAATQEDPMNAKKPLTERIVDALKKHGKLALDDLARHAGTTKATLYTMLGKLKDEGVVRAVAGERGVYEAGKGAPPPSAAPAVPRQSAKAKSRKARAPVAPRRADPPPPGAPNGEAHFAINEHGEIGIELDGTKVRLDAATFARLRAFIGRTRAVWARGKG